MGIVYGYMNRCKCGNLYLPSGKDICPPCQRDIKKNKWAILTKERQAKKTKKMEAKLAKRKAR